LFFSFSFFVNAWGPDNGLAAVGESYTEGVARLLTPPEYAEATVVSR